MICKKVYTCNMLLAAPFKQVFVAESGLIFVLDVEGVVTIVNKDLANDKNGIIHVMKNMPCEIIGFSLLSEKDGFLPNEPHDKT